MLILAPIAKQMRVVFTAITLLLMVGLNHREVTTFAATPGATAGQQIDNPATTRHGVVKQKVFFEATPSYVVYQLAAVVPALLKVNFAKPVYVRINPPFPAGILSNYFKILLSTSIQVNAP